MPFYSFVKMWCYFRNNHVLHVFPVFAGSTAVTPVFVQKGHDVLLEVRKDDVPEKFVLFVWKFRENVLVTFTPKSEPIVSKRYTGRVEFSVENYSVKLKNLQETDSGLYTAQVITNKQKILAEYKVTVQDPVSPVVLTVDSVSRSTNLCNLTVTCRTQDSHISSTFTSDTQTCSQEEGERSKVTASGASLQVYLVNVSIICNHSNQVSWTKNQEQTKIWNFCPRHCGSENLSAGFSYCLVKTVVFSVGLIIMVSAVIGVHLMETFKKKNQEEMKKQ
ncbi:SLAM family member 9-like isoform X5 [Channa argus]|uniref:SLAM family member 9-like isoform X5 n=1 Tax=Channa argus TaxID=215402 RepID=UPI00351FC3CD